MKIYRHQKIKLIKDLKQGDNTLRHSLIDINQFQNIDNAYNNQKQHFRIKKYDIKLNQYIPLLTQQQKSDLTPLQKLIQYKKQLIKDKFTMKYQHPINKMFQNNHKFIMRKSKIPKLLNDLNQNKKNDVNSTFQQQLKYSQEKLKFYRNQGQYNEDKLESNQTLINNNNNNNNNNNTNRYKFFSLKNGKPQMNQDLFPSFQLYVRGKNRCKLQEKYQFDVKKLEKTITNYLYTQKSQSQRDEQQQLQIPHEISTKQKNIFITSSPIKRYQKRSNANISNSVTMTNISPVIINSQYLKTFANNSNNKNSNNTNNNSLNRSSNIFHKSNSNNFKNLSRHSQKLISKSQKASKIIVKTMTGFYQSRKLKKREYNNMLQYYDHDRPLTNQIRRTQYQLNQQKDMKQIDFYREKSEQYRKKILSTNSLIYYELLNSLAKYHEDDISISIQILKQLRELFRKEYYFNQEDIVEIVKKIKNNHIKQNPEEKNQEKDLMVENVIKIINKGFNFTINWLKC